MVPLARRALSVRFLGYPSKMKNCIFNSVLSVIYVVFFTVSSISFAASDNKNHARQRDASLLLEEIKRLKEIILAREQHTDLDAKQRPKNLKGFYVGIGLSMVQSDFELDGPFPVDTQRAPFGFTPEYFGTTAHATVDWSLVGLNNVLDSIKLSPSVGFIFNDRYAVEFNMNYIPGLKWDNLELKDGKTYFIGSAANVQLTTFTTSLKYFPKFLASEPIRTFIHAGAGWMVGSIEIKHSSEDPIIITLPIAGGTDLPIPASVVQDLGFDTIEDSCAEFGLGFDLKVNTSTKLTFDAAHFRGFGKVQDLNFNKVTASIVYHL